MMVCYKSAVPIRASGGGVRGEEKEVMRGERERRKERRKREGKVARRILPIMSQDQTKNVCK
jgi:hypothetical protein